ncbi:MAG TPA: hypothetical protein VIM73_02405 [Polyangiaceae bacterium]
MIELGNSESARTAAVMAEGALHIGMTLAPNASREEVKDSLLLAAAALVYTAIGDDQDAAGALERVKWAVEQTMAAPSTRRTSRRVRVRRNTERRRMAEEQPKQCANCKAAPAKEGDLCQRCADNEAFGGSSWGPSAAAVADEASTRRRRRRRRW